MGRVILDASVLIALLDRADPHYERAVLEVEAADRGRSALVAPATAYGEALVAFARNERLEEARQAIAAMGIGVAPLDAATAERAAQLRATRPGLRLPDAMVLATAFELEGDLLTYDERLGRHARELGG